MAKSAAALPIFVSDGAEASVADSSDVWGFMWIESLQVGAFNEHQIPGLRGITSSLGSALSRHLITTRAQEALNGIPRAEVKQKLLSGLPVRENSEGYLVIADIRGSSGIANIYGAVVWYELISCLEDVFTELCKSYGLTYQFVIWDAFHFTIDEKNYRPDTIEKIVDFANEVNALIEYAFSKYFVAIPAPAGGARARFCIEFGDNTRDIRAGVWTVVGAVMANCSKLESACKHLSGWFFLSDSFSLKRPYEFEVLHEKNPATQRHIVSYLKKPNLDTCSDGIKKSLDDLINAKSIVAVAEQLKLSAEKSEKKAA
jgi:hypothetical protein